MPNEGLLKKDELNNYKVYQFGSFPLNSVTGKPKNGVFRIKLPPEADWTSGRAGTRQELLVWEEKQARLLEK